MSDQPGDQLTSKFLGGMIGSALGDAIGEIAFRHRTREALRSEVARRETLVYTDDTAMAIGLAESINQAGRLDPQHLGDTFRANFKREPWRGYASGPPTVFSRVGRRGISYAEAAQTLYGGEGSFGNGAAMRIAPVGLLFHGASDLSEKARLSASVTHAHPLGLDGAAVQAQAVAQVVPLIPHTSFPLKDFLQALADTARTQKMQGKVSLIQTVVARAVPSGQAARQLGRDVAVHQSLPFAIYAFLRHFDSFRACLFCAALNGGDRDTLGAMACAISGAYLGVEAIPSEWRRKLENRGQIEELAIGLAKMNRELRRSSER